MGYIFFLTTSFDFYRRNFQWFRLQRVFSWAVGKLQIEWTIIISRSDAKYARRRTSSIGAKASGLYNTDRSFSSFLFCFILFYSVRQTG